MVWREGKRASEQRPDAERWSCCKPKASARAHVAVRGGGASGKTSPALPQPSSSCRGKQQTRTVRRNLRLFSLMSSSYVETDTGRPLGVAPHVVETAGARCTPWGRAAGRATRRVPANAGCGRAPRLLLLWSFMFLMLRDLLRRF